MKILLVDDSEPAREPVELYLRRQGHEVVTADYGNQAIKALKRQPFDLVITDLRMPVMGGLDLLRLLKEENQEQEVIILTGYGDVESSVEALRLGASNYLMKPINMDELTLAVDHIGQRLKLNRRLREQEVKLAQARQMADLGLVTAGIAHEINNPNTFIRDNIQVLQKFWEVVGPYLLSALRAGVEAPPRLDFIMKETPGLLAAMLDGTERIKKIIENTATFSRSDRNDNLSRVDLNQCLAQVLESLKDDLAEIGLMTQTDPTLPAVCGREEDLVDIMTELLKNSIKALEGSPAPLIRIMTYSPAPGVVQFEVEDNGVGIKDEYKAKIFTPFFTTDPMIGRPGLGLSKVYALVRRCGGEVAFTSQEGQGSCFTIRLPSGEERKPVGGC